MGVQLHRTIRNEWVLLSYVLSGIVCGGAELVRSSPIYPSIAGSFIATHFVAYNAAVRPEPHATPATTTAVFCLSLSALFPEATFL